MMALAYNRKNAGPLLDSLQSCAHGRTSPEMKRPRVSTAGEDIEVAVALVLRALDNGVQLFDFRDDLWILLRKVATELDQNLDRFGAPMVGDEPSGVVLLDRLTSMKVGRRRTAAIPEGTGRWI